MIVDIFFVIVHGFLIGMYSAAPATDLTTTLLIISVLGCAFHGGRASIAAGEKE